MDTILITGVETVVGANLAAVLADDHHIVGQTTIAGLSIDNVEIVVGSDVEAIVARCSPSRIVCCGPASRSSWEGIDAAAIAQSISVAERWAEAAKRSGSSFTLISSDAVFTGPWMFHRENSTSHCPSVEAEQIRRIEDRVQELCTSSLIVRTNAYGWSPRGESGWIESSLASLAKRTSSSFDCLRHATPILATDLAGILQDAWRQELQGVYHIAGSERTNPAKFIERLAEEFERPVPSQSRVEPLTQRPEGFGCGETSLHTKKIRKTLDIVLPTVADGLLRLHQQQISGFTDKLCRKPEPVQTRVA